MRHPTTVEIGLAAALALILAAGWWWRAGSHDASLASLPLLPARNVGEPEIARLTTEAVSLFAAREFPRACRRFVEAAERQPDSPALRGNVARCFQEWGWETLVAGRGAEAMEHFRQGLERVPGDLDLLKGLGAAAIEAGRSDLAFEPLEEALRAGLDADAALLLARLYDQRDDAARAVVLLRRLLAKRPDRAEASRLLHKLERERAVEADFTREESVHFIVKDRGPRDADARHSVLRQLERLYADIGTQLGHHPEGKILVVLYPREHFQEVTAARHWVNGLFDGKIRLPADALTGGEALDRLLAHEYTHALVHSLSNGRAPRWLQEGLAQHFEGLAGEEILDLPGGLTLAAVEALLTDGDIASARTGYRAALWLVRDLLDRGGVPGLADILVRLGRGQTVAAAVEPVYGHRLQDLEAQWRLLLGAPEGERRATQGPLSEPGPT